MSFLLILAYCLFSAVEIYVLVCFKQNDRKLFFHSGLFTFLGFLLLTLAARLIFSFNIPGYFLVMCMLTIAAHHYFGWHKSCYLRYRAFDRCLHTVGSFSFTLLAFALLQNLVQTGGSRLFQSIFVFTLGMSLCALFEIVEYMTDVKHLSHMQRGLKDTNWDLIHDAVGSLAAGFVIYFI